MNGIISRVVLGVIRHGVGALFAGWAAKDWITGDQQAAALNATMVLVPILFSVYDKISDKKEK